MKVNVTWSEHAIYKATVDVPAAEYEAWKTEEWATGEREECLTVAAFLTAQPALGGPSWIDQVDYLRDVQDVTERHVFTAFPED